MKHLATGEEAGLLFDGDGCIDWREGGSFHCFRFILCRLIG
jgi:hypothetical protein